MNQDIYLNILKIHLAANSEKMGIENDFVFKHVNDPKHTTRQIKA